MLICRKAISKCVIWGCPSQGWKLLWVIAWVGLRNFHNTLDQFHLLIFVGSCGPEKWRARVTDLISVSWEEHPDLTANSTSHCPTSTEQAVLWVGRTLNGIQNLEGTSHRGHQFNLSFQSGISSAALTAIIQFNFCFTDKILIYPQVIPFFDRQRTINTYTEL